MFLISTFYTIVKEDAPPPNKQWGIQQRLFATNIAIGKGIISNIDKYMPEVEFKSHDNGAHGKI